MLLYVLFRDLGDLGGSVDREIAIDWLNGLEERNNSVQNTEPPESRVVLNRLPSDSWSMGFQSFLFGL